MRDGKLHPTQEGREAGSRMIQRSNHEGFFLALMCTKEGADYVLNQVSGILCTMGDDYVLMFLDDKLLEEAIGVL